MAAARFYSSQAGAIDLSADIASGDTSLTVSTTTGLPGTTPFTLVLDPGLSTEEIVTVTNVSGLTLTVARGADGSSPQAHSAGVGNVRHMATARDFREPQEHIGATADVHGVGSTSDVVGTETVQTLTNKTAQAATAASAGLVVKGAASQTASVLDVQDSGGGSLVSVGPAEGTLRVGSGQALVNGGGAANLFRYITRFTASAADVVAGIFRATASQTADILQIQKSDGTVLAKFDKDGNISAPNLTGGAWTAYTPGLSGITLGNGVLIARWAKVGKTVTARVRLLVGSTTSFTATTLRFSLPSPYASDYDQVAMGPAYLLDASTGSPSRTIAVAVATGGDTVFLVANTTGGTVTNAAPWSWAEGDLITFTAVYEEA